MRRKEKLVLGACGFAACSAFAMLTGTAVAETNTALGVVNMNWDGGDYSTFTATKTGTGAFSKTGGGGEFKWSVNQGASTTSGLSYLDLSGLSGDTLYTYCIEFVEYIPSKNTARDYAVVDPQYAPESNGPVLGDMGADKALLLRKWFTKYHTEVDTSVEKHAFQAGIWEIVYEDAMPASGTSFVGDTEGGNFTLSGSDSARSQTDAWFSADADNNSIPDWLEVNPLISLVALSSPNAGVGDDLSTSQYPQDQITISPQTLNASVVPTPTASWPVRLGLWASWPGEDVEQLNRHERCIPCWARTSCGVRALRHDGLR